MVHQRWFILILLALAPMAARADLDAYFKKAEPSFQWEKTAEQTVDGCQIVDLAVTSQEWQGMLWKHRVTIARPQKLEFPKFCMILNTGGNGGRPNDYALAARMANMTGATYAVVWNSPNQPIYGKNEDDLIVHTWLKFLETGDESWPLHFPMAKAVLKSMDAIQAFAKEAGWGTLDEFLPYGGSKRGWTTYLVGASKDPRVKAIAPLVIDILYVAKQTDHMLASYGKPSEQIAEYSAANIAELIKTPKGKRLMELEDPISYRTRYTMPKLLILGTNDRYWTQDALNLYWDDLPGPKWVLYVPNSGHGLEDRERAYATLTAFARMVAGRSKWPTIKWTYADRNGGAELKLSSDLPASEARLFRNSGAPTKDMRDSKWSFEPMKQDGMSFGAVALTPAEGFCAIFGEAVYTIAGRTFTLSTQVRILGGKK